ncbi:hypothetical protein K8R03_01570 [Candidatus Kaiserbacteria bacterium]|nr:hypothetical protein [Candidatus Kaiserbacteria bacterium]
MAKDIKKLEKRERFLRIAEYRVNDLLNRIRTISNLSNKSAYSYEEEDVNKIFSAAEQALRDAKARFRTTSKRREFKLRQ